jgi:hypothetical protein
MASKQEKQRRRAIVQQLRATEWEEACARKPISDEDLVALIDHIEATLFTRVDGKIATCCDHTLNRSRAFLHDRGVIESDVEKICEWFGEYGGFCDCEVAYNVADYWYSRLRDNQAH